MPAALNVIVYCDMYGIVERSTKRNRDSISPLPLYYEDNENKRQKKDEEDEEDQPYGHSDSRDMSEDESEAPGDNRKNPASNDRTDAFEATLKKLILDHEAFKLSHSVLKLNYETLKLDHRTLKLNHEILEANYESHKEKIKVRLEGLAGLVAQGTRAMNWLFGRLRATTKTA